MAELKRYNDFAELKLAATSSEKSDMIDLVKVKELERFFELLKDNFSLKENSLKKARDHGK